MAYGGHSFGKKTFHKPTYCHHCSDLLWGLIGQGYICEVCNFIVHEKCVTNVVTPCTGISPFLIKNPVAHCWSEPTHHKRKFCNVCRKRLDEVPAVHCLICEYYAHIECQDFAIADCKENATYVPGKDLSSVKHVHHWREGNLPQSSKCASCKKTCWSSECLTGYRCEWCGFTTHGGCRHYVSQECTFGALQPIYLPPHAVSIPRTEVPMEAILGVQAKNKQIPMQREYSCPELRTISLCDSDSDLFMQTYNVIHRKSSDSSHSAAVSYYSGTESQQSVSDRSFYDNIAVDDVFEHHHHTHHSHNINNNSNHHYTKARNYLMPPINNLPLRLLKNPHINVNRSVSFQGTCGTYLTPRHNIIIRRRHDENIFNDTPSDFGSTRSSISPSGSNPSPRNNTCDCSSIIPKTNVQIDRNLMDESYCYKYHYDKKYDGPFYLKMLRRMQKIFKRQSKKSLRARSISDDLSSGDAARFRDDEYGKSESASGMGSSSARNESAHKGERDKEKKEKDKEEFEETIKVFDGNCSLRRRIFRAITVPRTCNLEQLLTTALRAFHIAREPNQFYLTDLYATNGDEIQIQDPTPVLNLHKIEGKRPAIFLRFREKEIDKGFVRVYPGKLQVEEPYVTVQVDNDTTVKDLIREALNNFALQDHQVDDYRCLEILLDRGVSERVLSWNERPWEIMKQLAKDSIRQMELMRFYLQLKQDPHGPNVALFVGNLPLGLSQRNYEQILIEILGSENKFSSIGPIYYEYGSLVITYENASKAVRALYALRESKSDDKQLLVLLLPNIEPSMVPTGVKPLLVFVNVKSGGCQGLELISSFRKLLNPYQVFDLDNGGPLPGLYVFRHIQDYKILVCGGDGTIGWVLQCLDNVGQDSECSSPPCAIVPLGTGNDLARVLRWGAGYTGGEDPLNLLRDVIDAEEIRLDRWTVVFHPEDKPEDVAPKAPTNSTGKKKKDQQQTEANSQSNQHHHHHATTITTPLCQVVGGQSEDNSQIFVMNNYFGIGIDADLCLDFHNAREENPNKFNSRLHNKGVYVKMGLRKMVGRKMCKDLHKEIRLEVDGKHVELPPVEGIIILNILSWGSGANPWGPEKEDAFSKPNHWDGMLEVVGVTGVVHLGQIQSGLRSAMRIAQGGHIKIHLHSETPVQVDGEPWVQSPGDVVVLKSALKATMLKKIKSKRRLTEPHISPAVAGSSGAPENNGDRDKEPLSGT
ncbi:diacylglycerol kinase theta isoform X4 [Chironomus tepperi]|uniref:diacylglycerol kinase theta isoform X4 n=1 Tax=Chironomus tepperi TaxID=113505 RepID=UPI00391F124C